MRQDQKQTPSKYASRSYKKRMFDQALSKDLLCPFIQTFSPALLPNFTPMRKQPQYLLSPSPIKKDLFSQLLGTQTKHNSPYLTNSQAIQQQQNMSMSEISSEEEQDNSMLEENSSDGQANWSQENGIKKRKRKSTAQIKLLKQELDGEMNWTKEKIVKMAQITGLSQSQVYKWCWDQKKKQNKGKDDHCRSYMEKRKIIKKSINMRPDNRCRKQEDSEDQQKQNMKQYLQSMSNFNNMKRTMTKPKPMTVLTDVHETEKKVNKRLVFY